MSKQENARRAESLPTDQRNGLESSVYAPFTADTFSEYTARTLALVREGREWVAACPAAWAAAQHHVLDCAIAGRRISWHEVASAMLSRDYIDHRNGQNVRIDNTLGPLFMRWLVGLHPEIEPFMEQRRSRFDEVEIGGPYDLL